MVSTLIFAGFFFNKFKKLKFPNTHWRKICGKFKSFPFFPISNYKCRLRLKWDVASMIQDNFTNTSKMWFWTPFKALYINETKILKKLKELRENLVERKKNVQKLLELKKASCENSNQPGIYSIIFYIKLSKPSSFSVFLKKVTWLKLHLYVSKVKLKLKLGKCRIT